MNRQHRQERQKGACNEHGENVAEIRARRHVDVLDNVAEGFASFENAFFENHQVLFQQDDVARLLGDIGRAVDGNADIRVFQSRGIIDAVA